MLAHNQKARTSAGLSFREMAQVRRIRPLFLDDGFLIRRLHAAARALASAASISLIASVSVMRCTAEISRDSRSSAAS